MLTRMRKKRAKMMKKMRITREGTMITMEVLVLGVKTKTRTKKAVTAKKMERGMSARPKEETMKKKRKMGMTMKRDQPKRKINSLLKRARRRARTMRMKKKW